jgi:probable rRNA maturation factor
MHMNKQNKTLPEFSLSVQYGVADARLPRWRLRRWVELAIHAAHEDALIDFKRVQLGLKLVGQAEGRKMNASFRQKDHATNVLTFEYGVDPEGTATGDIVLCLPVLIREAREQSKSMIDHAAHLTIHGTLHALGYDHLKAKQAKHMEALETRILARMKICDPYA